MASNAPNTGGYDCKFLETPPDKLVCQICLHVACSPHQMTCCGRVYCKACLDEHKKHSSTCPNCRERGQDFPDTRGEQEIKALKVKCNNSENGCGWVAELWSLDNHLTTCGYALLHCTNQCMENNIEVRILRCDLDHHLKNKCPNRQHQCPHCKTIGRYCDITTTHLDTCHKLKIPCPNSGCDVKVSRCDLADHQSKCPFEKVPCKYAGIGCQKRPLCKDLQQHEKDDAILHLQLAVKTVNKQQEEINELREEIDELEEEIDEQQEEMKKQQEEITKHQEEMKAVKDEQIVMSDGIMACQAGTCIFKMTKYHHHKSSKGVWYSPAFYSHPGGYKMCIKIYANGCDDGASTHVSVFAYLMRGKNDDNLPWPFTGRAGITLLNQLIDKNHYTSTISFPQDSDVANKRVVDSERAHTGYGQPTFIPHNQLGYNTAQNCQYLKDDCLYFQIKVHAANPVKPWLTCTV